MFDTDAPLLSEGGNWTVLRCSRQCITSVGGSATAAGRSLSSDVIAVTRSKSRIF